MNIKISPSILAADFCNLQREIERVPNAEMLHLDVMDGHFVPNISIGVPVVESIRKQTSMFLDVHLMISHPLQYVEAFAKAGADLICFHIESEDDPKAVIDRIHQCGKQAAIALKPNTPAEVVFKYLQDLEMVLVMTVEPGFGGQSFMADMVPKIEAIRARVSADFDIQVDGGINCETAKTVVEAGANVLVAGSFVFGSQDPSGEVSFLQGLS